MRTPIQHFLATQTTAEHVIAGGLDYLVKSWERAVEYWEGSHYFEEDEMLNDADGRELLQKVLTNFEIDSETLVKIDLLDKRFLSTTEPSESETPEDFSSWWYHRQPKVVH